MLAKTDRLSEKFGSWWLVEEHAPTLQGGTPFFLEQWAATEAYDLTVLSPEMRLLDRTVNIIYDDTWEVYN